DRLMNQVISSRLSEADCQQGFLLDGYPRTVAQARFLNGLLMGLGMPGPLVFQFNISNDDVVSRLRRRLQCAECGGIFSMNTNVLLSIVRAHYCSVPVPRTRAKAVSQASYI